ncbi:molecular chaperone, partial [Salmonella enterica]|nr:molecular chaperone [Salmonella enterica]
KRTFLIIISLCCVIFNASAIQLYSSRVIYNEGQKEVLFRIKNESDTSPYLVQSWVSKFNSEDVSDDFIIIPPLINLTPESVNNLRIIFSSNHNLPARYESIYRLNILSIPAVEDTDTTKVTLTTKLSLKLIYRPVGLTYNEAKEAHKKLSAKKNGNSIIIENPTPYFVNLKEVSLNTGNIDREQFLKISTIEPFGTVAFECKSLNAHTINILAIDDYGATHKSQITFDGI